MDRNELLQGAVRKHIYYSEHPNYHGLEQELLECGFTRSEVFCILMGVREGDY